MKLSVTLFPFSSFCAILVGRDLVFVSTDIRWRLHLQAMNVLYRHQGRARAKEASRWQWDLLLFLIFPTPSRLSQNVPVSHPYWLQGNPPEEAFWALGLPEQIMALLGRKKGKRKHDSAKT